MHRHNPPAWAIRAAIIVVIPSVIALAFSVYLLSRPPPTPCPTPSMLASPSTAKPQSYSLWAIPSKDSAFYKRSKEAIQTLSKHFSSVTFEPHVTVVGLFGAHQGLTEDEVVLRSWQIVKQMRPYDVKVLSLAAGGSYFQSVFLKIRPTEKVLEAHDSTRKKLNMDLSQSTLATYMPHLSLIYGHLNTGQKEEAMEIVRQSFADIIAADAHFRVESLALVRTELQDEKLKTWETIAEFPLNEPLDE